MKIRNQILIAVNVLTLISAIVLVFTNYSIHKHTSIEGIDEKLVTVARFSRSLIPESYHTSITDQNSVSPDEYDLLVGRFNELCTDLDIQYIWSVMEDGGRIRFTTSTARGGQATQQEYARFYDIHSDPDAFSTAMQTMRTEYSSFKNEWGEGRMVLIPTFDGKGRKVIYGASVEITDINRHLNETLIKSIFLGTLFWIAGLLISFFFIQISTRPFVKISKISEQIARGKLDEKIQLKGGAEIQSLTDSINQMRLAIKGKVIDIEDKNRRLQDEVAERTKAQEELTNIKDSLEMEITDSAMEIAKLSQAVNQSESTIVITDLDGRIQFANPAFTHVTGYKIEEVLGENPRLLSSGKHPSEFYKEMWDTITRGKTWRGEIINRKKNGEFYWESAIISPIKDPHGNIINYLAVKDDVTKRVEAEQALRASEGKFRDITEMLPSVVFQTDLQGNIDYMNRSAMEMLGYKEDDLKKPGFNALKLFIKNDHERLMSCVTTVLNRQGKELGWTNFTIIKRNSVHMPVSIIASHIEDESGAVIGLRGVMIDISEQQRVERELIQAKNLAEKANQSKSAFLANMSHELRTPLNGIIGFTQILERQLDTVMSDKQKVFFNTIKSSGFHLLEMVNDILDLSKIEAGKVELEIKPFNFTEALRRSTDVVQADARKKNIKISTSIPDDLGWLNGDETRLKQVLFNLLSNAVKFTNSGQKIGMEASYSGEEVSVTVWDEGRGIAPENIDRVFDPFEQGAENHTIAESGTGLGLSISKRLIELHHGTVSLESVPGEGSRFTICLPGRFLVEEAEEKMETATIDSSTSDAEKRYRLLVTDDSLPNRELIDAVLGDIYFMEFAATGEEAVSKAEEMDFDGVLMDINLPKMDGVEALKRIRTTRNAKKPVIALTAFAMKGDEEKYLSEGFDGYVSKPLNIDELVKTLSLKIG